MTQEQQRRMEIAKTILLQIGGQHFKTMVGARDIVALDSGLQLDFMKNPSKANRLRVIYNVGTDTYTMQFWKKPLNVTLNMIAKYSAEQIKQKTQPKLIKEFSECYADDLRRLFETTTKLRTSLTHIYGEI